MLKHLKRLWSGEEGQGMAEYGLILALVAVVAMLALKALGTGVADNFGKVANELKPAG